MKVIVRGGFAGPSAEPALKAMFEDRKSVFADLLKWDVPVVDGMFELDEFDDRHATYAWTCAAAFSRERPGHARRPPDFLERTLGYFNDPRIAFVQTPQDFYIVDSFQHRGKRSNQEVWHEQTLFYRVIQPGKDRWNAAFLCGSCAIVRRKALDDIGGFATGTITRTSTRP